MDGKRVEIHCTLYFTKAFINDPVCVQHIGEMVREQLLEGKNIVVQVAEDIPANVETIHSEISSLG